MKRLLLVTFALSACIAEGSAMTAPPPPRDEAIAPEPPARAAQSSLVTWKGRPGDHVEWLAFPAQKSLSDASWGPALTDVENHLPSSYGTTYRDADKITHGHETSHGIHAHLRNYFNKTGQRANALYVLGDRAAIVVEPKIRKSQVAPFVPTSLRGSRYATYVTGQTAWDDTPLYVWDEWNAYVNGGAVGTDLVKRGLWKAGWRDGVNGQLEFAVYAVAVAMAVQKHDPAYLEGNQQFRELLAWNLRRTMSIFREGQKMKEFAWATQDAYYERMKTGADAAPWRAFFEGFFGDAFTKEVLFGATVGDAPDAGPPDDDADDDGVPDAADTCGKTPPGANVWREGEWIGCATGQRRDSGPWGGADADADGVADGKDRCSKTPPGAPVWTHGEWIGCAAGQLRDA
ncbi:MAG: hypothetical protein HYV09_40760 [Deltaproteobacteria bacterium]|nr:hypothetical protein [Deltaproteobacteria bacterium]